MKKYTLIVLLFPFLIFAQDFTMVDNVTRSAYKRVTTITDLAEHIDYDFKTDIEKVRAVYIWLTHNIMYREKYSRMLTAPEFLVYYSEEDVEKALMAKTEKKILNTFNNRQGVCEGYALLFKRICDLMHIENELVYGYTKTSGDYIGFIPKTKNHVWNAVKIKDRWMMIDATYGAGYVSQKIWYRKFNNTFFDVQPEVLNKTHFPSEIKWRYFLKLKSLDDFCKDPVVTNAYFKHKIDVIEPKNGVIEAKNKSFIKFKIKGVKQMQSLLYVLGSEKVIRIPKVTNKIGYSNYYLKKPKNNTTLQIYIDNELTLEYTVKVE